MLGQRHRLPQGHIPVQQRPVHLVVFRLRPLPELRRRQRRGPLSAKQVSARGLPVFGWWCLHHTRQAVQRPPRLSRRKRRAPVRPGDWHLTCDRSHGATATIWRQWNVTWLPSGRLQVPEWPVSARLRVLQRRRGLSGRQRRDGHFVRALAPEVARQATDRHPEQAYGRHNQRPEGHK